MNPSCSSDQAPSVMPHASRSGNWASSLRRQSMKICASTGCARLDRNPHEAVDGVLPGSGDQEGELFRAVEVLRLRPCEFQKVTASTTPVFNSSAARRCRLVYFSAFGCDLVDQEGDRLVHLVGILIVQPKRRRNAEQDAAAGDVARQPHQQLALQSLVGQVLPVVQEVDIVAVVVDARRGRGLETDRSAHDSALSSTRSAFGISPEGRKSSINLVPAGVACAAATSAQ